MLLHHVAMAVKDMERSLAFYRDVLGLEVVTDSMLSGNPDLDRCVMEAGTVMRMAAVSDKEGRLIELQEWRNPPVLVRPPEHLKFRSTGLTEVCLSVPDLEKLEADLGKKGLTFRTPVWAVDFSDMPGIKTRMAHMLDPDGVQVQFIELP